MFRVPSGPAAYFDVDDTLVQWNDPEDPEFGTQQTVFFKDHVNQVYINKYNVELLKKFSARGHAVIVWPAGGVDWAEAVVNSLGLESYVHAVLSKPSYYIDDYSDPAKIIGKRVFLNYKGEKEAG